MFSIYSYRNKTNDIKIEEEREKQRKKQVAKQKMEIGQRQMRRQEREDRGKVRSNPLYNKTRQHQEQNCDNQARLNKLYQQQQCLLQNQGQRELGQLKTCLYQGNPSNDRQASSSSSSLAAAQTMSFEEMLNEDLATRIENISQSHPDSGSSSRTSREYVSELQQQKVITSCEHRQMQKLHKQQTAAMSLEQMMSNELASKIEQQENRRVENKWQQKANRQQKIAERRQDIQNTPQQSQSIVVDHVRMDQLERAQQRILQRQREHERQILAERGRRREGGTVLRQYQQRSMINQEHLLDQDFIARLEQLDGRNDGRLQRERLVIEQSRIAQLRKENIRQRAVSTWQQREEQSGSRRIIREPGRMDALQQQQQRLLQLQRQREIQRQQQMENQQMMRQEQSIHETHDRINRLQQQRERMLQLQRRRADLQRRSELQQQIEWEQEEHEQSSLVTFSSHNILSEENLPTYHNCINEPPPPSYSKY